MEKEIHEYITDEIKIKYLFHDKELHRGMFEIVERMIKESKKRFIIPEFMYYTSIIIQIPSIHQILKSHNIMETIDECQYHKKSIKNRIIRDFNLLETDVIIEAVSSDTTYKNFTGYYLYEVKGNDELATMMKMKYK